MLQLNIEKLADMLEFARQFGIYMIEDDKHDIGFSNSIQHPSQLHHYKWGAMIVAGAEVGLKLIDIHKMFTGSVQTQLPPQYMGWIGGGKDKNKKQKNNVIPLKKRALPAPPSPPSAPKI
jgi:hypothetical protein